MNTSSDIAKAFEIFKYYESSRPLTASNGEVYAGPHPDKVSNKDKDALNKLGWKEKSVDGTFVYTGNGS